MIGYSGKPDKSEILNAFVENMEQFVRHFLGGAQGGQIGLIIGFANLHVNDFLRHIRAFLRIGDFIRAFRYLFGGKL